MSDKGSDKAQKIVVTIQGSDKVGIVAAITAALAQCRVNIEDIRQTIMQGHFVMLMLCDIATSDKSFKEVKEIITAAGKTVDMEVWIQRKEIFDSMHSV